MLSLLQCGDIESNPEPMPNILHKHPTTHKRIANTYFIPNTIKFHLEYQHFAKSSTFILKHAYSLHQQSILTFVYLHQYIQTQNHSHLPYILYFIFINIYPSINIYNNILAQPNTYHFNIEWIDTLINKLANLTNTPERHIFKQHLCTKFIEKY